ncbi:MAG: amidase [Gemmatimonadales bacterium]
MSASSHEDRILPNLSRRAFVGVGIAGAIAAVTGLSPTEAEAEAETDAVVAPVTTTAAPPAFALEEATISQLQQWMASGRYTSRALCEMYLKRISEVDRTGPAIRAVLQLNPDVLAIADGLDAERKAGHLRGPLHGIPVLIKDNIDTHDRMTTAAGSLALAKSIAPRDSFVASRLRLAGAVILGKTNLSEWANYRSTHSSSGWSGMGGQTHNPYALDRTPSGSSSGSGAAAADSLCAIAVGTETDGSITSPSAAQSLVGIKPTVGLISRAGIIPISHSQDTAGPMARTVTDAAILLGALTGVDSRDVATAASKAHSRTDYTTFLDANGLRGARIGIPRKNYFGYSVATDAIIEHAIAVMRSAGAIVIDPIELGGEGKGEGDVLSYEFKADVNAYLASLGAASPMKTLADLIAFNNAHRAEEMPYFGQEIFETAEARGPLTEKKYRDALASGHARSRARGIDAAVAKYRLDAIAAPTQGPPSLIDLVNGDPGGGGSASSLPAVAGYPHITVPAGYSFGLPVGLSLFGPAWSEGVLIKLAYAFEQKTKVRRSPKFRATANLDAHAADTRG